MAPADTNDLAQPLVSTVGKASANGIDGMGENIAQLSHEKDHLSNGKKVAQAETNLVPTLPEGKRVRAGLSDEFDVGLAEVRTPSNLYGTPKASLLGLWYVFLSQPHGESFSRLFAGRFGLTANAVLCAVDDGTVYKVTIANHH